MTTSSCVIVEIEKVIAPLKKFYLFLKILFESVKTELNVSKVGFTSVMFSDLSQGDLPSGNKEK